MLLIGFMLKEIQAVRDLDMAVRVLGFSTEKLFIHSKQKAAQIFAPFCEWEKISQTCGQMLEEQQHNYTSTTLRTGNDLCNRPAIQPPVLIRKNVINIEITALRHRFAGRMNHWSN